MMSSQKYLFCLTIFFIIFIKSAYSEYIWNGSEWEWVTNNDYNYLYDSTEEGSGDNMGDDSEGSGLDSIYDISSTTTYPTITTTKYLKTTTMYPTITTTSPKITTTYPTITTTTYPKTTTMYPVTTTVPSINPKNTDDIVEEFESKLIKVNINEPNEKHSILSVLRLPVLTPPKVVVEKTEKTFKKSLDSIDSEANKENRMTEIQLRHENKRLKNALRKIRELIEEVHNEISGLDINDDIPL